MKILNLPLAVFSVCFLISCGNGNSSSKNTSSEQPSLFFPSRLFMDLDKTNTHIGIDANNDGIRDDVERVINTYPKLNDAQKKALKQDARFHQLIQVNAQNGTLTKAKSDELANLSVRATSCFGDAFDSSSLEMLKKNHDLKIEAPKLIEAISHNTEKRAMAYLEYNKLQNHTWITLPEGNTCDE